ncbi:MAG: hypothetical protein Q8L29_04200, partial [archaeon]|nr:hypothetical protein [archaeon]
FGYKTDVQRPSELAKNAFVIALAGEEGAEKLAKIAENYRNNPGVWSFQNVDEEIARVSGLDGDYLGVRLLVNGYDFDGDNGNSGCAFGVSQTSAEGAKSAKK